MKDKKIILITILLIAGVNFFIAPISVLMPVYVESVLKMNATGLSYISVSLAVGTIVGGLIISIINNKLKSSNMIVYGNVSIGFFIILLSIPAFDLINFIKPIYLASFAFFAIGFSIVIVTAPLKTYVFKYTPKEIMGRVVSLLGMVSLSALPLGSFLSGVIAEVLPLSIMYLSIGLLLMIISFLPLINKEFRNE